MTDTVIDLNGFLGIVAEAEQGARQAWTFLIRVGAAALFAFAAYRVSRESRTVAWKLHLYSVACAAALAFIFGGGGGRDMDDYDGIHASGPGYDAESEPVSIPKRIESFFVVAAAMAVGVTIGVRERNKVVGAS